MSNLNIHAATLKDGHGTRLVVAYKQIPGNPLNALVIKVDSLARTVDRDELLILSKSTEAQREKDFINLLHRKGLLEHFHNSGYLSAVSVDDVLMTPGDGKKIPLRDIVNAINHQQGIADLPTVEEMQHISEANPHAAEIKQELLDTSNKQAIAKSIFFQANMLQEEANRKYEQAFGLDPSLRPQAIPTANVAGEVIPQPEKRKRGRPQGYKVPPKVATGGEAPAAPAANPEAPAA
jgi:hypothetical protein